MRQIDLDRWHMSRALELAAQGRGAVEPNPLVGCLIAHGAEIVGEGWHRRYGGPHAEIEALAIAGRRAAGATAYVTLEPCCHHGKTPPCTDALIAAGVARVVAAGADPFPEVSGQGLARLQAAGIECTLGVREDEARQLNAPYFKLLASGQPWVIAKWAMTLDGKIASRTGASRWISSQASRAVAHRLRGQVDAILVGIGTALADDPQLTVRPPGLRTPVRVVLDGTARLPLTSQLVQTARQTPTLVAVAPSAPADRVAPLQAHGCEVLTCAGASPAERLQALLSELGRRRLTNVLVEGGSQVLASCLEQRAIDEVHVFIAPRLLGGADAISPIAGVGFAAPADALALERVTSSTLDGDLYLHGFLPRSG
jgi:diaminohydroxyphosphoribosylaminopyrimidine deaminase/5-amino-6-(5-phosphoribosylamino)uracil reductase